jgi:hypothetical protein
MALDTSKAPEAEGEQYRQPPMRPDLSEAINPKKGLLLRQHLCGFHS